jgi:hypothetical protein
MLKLTTEEGLPVYVNPGSLFSIHVGDKGRATILSIGTAYVGVKESAEDVARMVDEAGKPKEFTSTERQDVVRQLREVCGDYGDNDWPDNLHLGDVIEKHLARNLYENYEP